MCRDEEENFNEVSFGDNSPICRNKSGCFAAKRAPKCVKSFDGIERAGSEVTYRCPECRNCDKCKNGPRVENISFQEEIEQDLIERSVTGNIDRGITTAKFPFSAPLDTCLVTNENIALKVYRAQLKKLSIK